MYCVDLTIIQGMYWMHPNTYHLCLLQSRWMPFACLCPRNFMSLETSKQERGPSQQVLFLDLDQYYTKLAGSIIARWIF